MQPTLDFHAVRSIEVGPITFFEQTDVRAAFWSRRVWITDMGGRTFDFGLYSNSSTGLLLKDCAAQPEAVMSSQQKEGF